VVSSRGASILDALRANADRHPDKLLYAFLNVDGRTTQSYAYEGFLRRTADIAAHIHRAHPLGRGERVLLVYPPGLEMICALFACARLGLIPVPVYPPSSHGFAAALYKMNFIAEDCRAAAVLTDRACYWSLKLHRARTSLASLSLKRDYTSRLRWIVTSDAESIESGGFPEAHSEILFLQYTSGSTNDPKGVMVTHGNVLSNCDAVVDHLPVMVSWLPQYHDMGLIAFYLFTAIVGGTTYGCSPMDFIRRPLLWLEAITRHRATASAAPNFAYEYCLRPDKVDDQSLELLDLSSIRVLLNGAEPVKPRVFNGFLYRFGPRGLKPDAFSTAYGLAENTLAVTGHGRETRSFDAAHLGTSEGRTAPRPREGSERKSLVSCGRPLGATQIAIVDVERLREVPEGRVGEVWVAGPSKCLGYWGRPVLSEEVFEAQLEGDEDPGRSWLRTGDLGFVQQRELFICGRAKDVIIVRGANYYPQDIEALVEEDPAVRRGCVAAFAAPDDDRVVVVAELRDAGRRPDARGIESSVRKRLGIGVDLFVFIPKRTIPKTSSGKISRHRARREWQEGRLEVVQSVETGGIAGLDAANGVPGAPADEGAVAETELARLFRRYGLSGRQEGTLSEAGLDSLALVDFALDVERHLEGHGDADLAGGVEVRWLQAIAVSELFELLAQIDQAAPGAKLRFRHTFASLRREHAEAERQMMRRDARLTVEIPERVRVCAKGAPSSGAVLLTGGTGFFGPFLLRSLLEQTCDPIYVLVRAPTLEHAHRRLEQGLATLGSLPTGYGATEWRDRVRPLCGDLALPSFGVSPASWSALTEDVRAVYHNGALVNYLLDYAGMRDVNVGGMNEVIRLSASGRPKVLNHISSTFVFGWSTKETLFETDTNRDMALLDFGYSQTKWVSEQLVLAAIARGLSARVFRPALIAPSVTGGGYNFDIAIRLLAFMLHHGISTTARNQVSLTPADVAAANIVAISNLPDTVGETFHVTRDLYSSLEDVTRLLGALTETEFVSYSVHDFVSTMIERCGRGDLLFPLVDFFVRSVDNITGMEFKRYDSRSYQAARDRSPDGIPDPPLEDVVAGILRFMARNGVIEGRKAELVLGAHGSTRTAPASR
jgi:thioester reductase-like protein